MQTGRFARARARGISRHHAPAREAAIQIRILLGIRIVLDLVEATRLAGMSPQGLARAYELELVLKKTLDA